MSTALLSLKFRGEADVLRARQRARQITRILGYEPLEQSRIAACAFEMARCALRHGAVLAVQLEADVLKFVPRYAKRSTDPSARNAPPLCPPPTGARGLGWEAEMVFPLPDKALSFERNDLAWIIQQLNRITPLCLFDEIRQQNLEVLHLSRVLTNLPGDLALESSAA